jgi:hypothetical protein
MTSRSLTSARHEFDDTFDAIEGFFERGWTDGLPVVPPTERRVESFLSYADVDGSAIIGTEPTKGRVITAEKLAVNAVMAGCKPEYFPVVIAAIEAMCEAQFNLHAITASTMGAAPLLVVNGPVAKQIGLNSGVSVFGPGHRANATIGRAIRLIIINVTGSASGEIDKATIGHPGKYTWCIAESEQVSPWEPLHVERGLDPEQSAVTVFAGLSPVQVNNHESNDPQGILTTFKDAVFSAGPGQGEMVCVICPEHLDYMRSFGWSKSQVKEFLHLSTRRSVAEWKAAGKLVSSSTPANDVVTAAESPDSFTVIAAGGLAGAFSDVIPLWGGGSNSRSVTKEIRLP